MPKFSIIITTCNRRKFFERAFKTAVNQENFDDYEIIVVNNGEEKIEDIVEKYKNNRNVKIINYNKGKGAAISANIGIKNSNGEWICFLDDDDELLPNYLEELNKNISEEDNWILITSIWKKEAIEKIMLDKKLLKIQFPMDLLKIIFKRNYLNRPFNIIKKEIYQKLGYFDTNLKVAEDLEFVIRLILNNYRFKLIAKPLYIYHIHKSQLTKLNYEYIKASKKIFSKYKEILGSNKEIESDFYYTIGWQYMRLKKEKEAYKFFKKSFFLKPNLRAFVRTIISYLELDKRLNIEKFINKITNKFWLE